MSCKVTNVNFCQVKAQTWKSRKVTFDRDVSGDEFKYTVKGLFSNVEKTLTLSDGISFLDSSSIAIQDPDLEIGSYSHSLLWTSNGITRVVFSGSLNVVETGSDTSSCDCEFNFEIKDCDEIVEVEIAETVVNIQGATIDVDSTVTVDPDEPAKVENVGTQENVRLKFYIPMGVTGKSVEVNWQGTSLGVRVEGQDEYQYVNLKGDTGNGIEFDWQGTQLGVRVQGDDNFQYVDLKGEKGDPFIFDDFTPEQIKQLQEPLLNGIMGFEDKGSSSTININKDYPAVTSYQLDDDTQITVSEPDQGEAYVKMLIVTGDYQITMPVGSLKTAYSDEYDGDKQNQIVILVAQGIIQYSINVMR